MKNKILLTGLMVIAGLFAIMANWNDMKNQNNSGETGLIINEVIADNRSLYGDAYGEFRDIVELYNGTSQPIDLEGYGISDDPDRSHKYTFTQVIIEPYAYLVLFGGDSRDQEEDLSGSFVSKNADQTIYLGFNLDKKGEKILLSDSQGQEVHTLAFGPMEANMSYGLSSEGGYVYYSQGSPNMANEGYVIEDMDKYLTSIEIRPNLQPGIYNSEIRLEFSLENMTDSQDMQLKYTLDGSDPNPSSLTYQEGIIIDRTDDLPLRYVNIPATFADIPRTPTGDVSKGQVVKAQYFSGDLALGHMFTGTYYVWDQGSDRYAFDVVSLTTDPDHLFNEETGIYVVGKKYLERAPRNPDGGTPANYNQRGPEWERPAHVEFFDSQGDQVFSQDIGIRLFGGWSRANEKKSFKLLARDEYGQPTMDYDFFEGLTDSQGERIDSFKRLLFRSGGNDFDQALFRDLMIDSLVEGLVDYQAYKQVILFINGEYYGIYHLREHLDEHYLESHYNIPEDQVSIITYLPDGLENYYGSEEDFQSFKDFLSYVKNHDLTIDEHFKYVEDRLDLANLMDYYITNLYIANSDWPGNNSKIWRYTGQVDESTPDGRYRFLMYDTEFSFGMYEGSGKNAFDSFSMLLDTPGNAWPNPGWSINLFQQLMENESFKEDFAMRFADLMNSRFHKDRVIGQIEYFEDLYEPEMEEYIERYHFWAIHDTQEWKTSIVYGLKSFAEKRSMYLMTYAKRHLDLGPIKTLKISDFKGGTIRVNDSYYLKDLEDLFTLKYYEGQILGLKAIPEKGYKFAGWETEDESLEGDLLSGNLDTDFISFALDSFLEIRPVFVEE